MEIQYDDLGCRSCKAIGNCAMGACKGQVLHSLNPAAKSLENKRMVIDRSHADHGFHVSSTMVP